MIVFIKAIASEKLYELPLFPIVLLRSYFIVQGAIAAIRSIDTNPIPRPGQE